MAEKDVLRGRRKRERLASKTKKLEKRLEKTSLRRGVADEKYKKQLEKEERTDIAKGRTRGTTTRRRRNLSKIAQKTIGYGLMASGLGKAKKALDVKRHMDTAKYVKGLSTAVAGNTAILSAGAWERPTVFEPKLRKKTRLRRKSERLKDRIDKKKEKIKALDKAYGK